MNFEPGRNPGVTIPQVDPTTFYDAKGEHHPEGSTMLGFWLYL